MKIKIYLIAFAACAMAIGDAQASAARIACLKGKVPSSMIRDLDCLSDYDATTKDGMCFIKFTFGPKIKKELARNVPEEWYESKALATYSKKTNGVVVGQAIIFDDSITQGRKPKIDIQALTQAHSKTNKQIGQAVGIANPKEFPATLQGLSDLRRYLGPAPADCVIPTRE